MAESLVAKQSGKVRVDGHLVSLDDARDLDSAIGITVDEDRAEHDCLLESPPKGSSATPAGELNRLGPIVVLFSIFSARFLLPGAWNEPYLPVISAVYQQPQAWLLAQGTAGTVLLHVGARTVAFGCMLVSAHPAAS